MASPSPSFQLLPETPEIADLGIQEETTVKTIPPIRWIMVGYFFWVGIFLGALIMHAATSY